MPVEEYKKNINLINISKIIEKELPENFIKIEKTLPNFIIKEIINFNISKIQSKILIKNNPNYSKLITTSPNLLQMDVLQEITPDNIAEFAYPLAQFVNQVKPDYIFALDRGARIIALAVAMMHRELYGPLPTKDRKINFRRISKSASESAIRNLIKHETHRMLAQTEAPTVLILDDWVSSGATKQLVETFFKRFSNGQINLLYGVMRGTGADITGNKKSTAMAEWHDNPEIIGVDYYGDSLQPHKVRSSRAIEYRKRMSQSIKNFVKTLKAK